jgi:hypothetical protein
MGKLKTVTEKYGEVVGRVLSSNKEDWYPQRKLAKGQWFCSCKAWRVSYSTGGLEKFKPCKHQIRIWAAAREAKKWSLPKKNRVWLADGIEILVPEAF